MMENGNADTGVVPNTTLTEDMQTAAHANEAWWCVTCAVGFADEQQHKKHHKTDWHRYNLRRRVADMAPLAELIYNRKVELIMANAAETQPKGRSHLKVEKKHRMDTVGGRDQQNEEGETHTARERIVVEYSDNTKSLFDSTLKFNTLERNVAHMEKRFCLFFPDRDYLVDLPGLITYLGKKVYERNCCIFCDRQFGSAEATQGHMLAKGHTRIGTEKQEMLDELEGFYDYSKSYLELATPSRTRTAAVTPLQDLSVVGGGEMDEWEDLTAEVSMEGLGEDDRTEAAHHEDDKQLKNKLKQFGLRPAKLTDHGRLRLPNGNLAGNRSLAYIYKQRLRGQTEATAAAQALHIEEDLYRQKALQTDGVSSRGGGGYAVCKRGGETETERAATAAAGVGYHRRIQNSHMRLGVKSNILQKYVKRRERFCE
eukprot:GHVQ01021111.1.p1 GENE.GHVQ01021111.1~~GHVQ01021111.1.p1  ORF type:complete len:427 (-),score=88.16 GHVQ01021111.1:114-1394(-)